MASITQADAGVASAAALPQGMMLPVQALSTGFVHETLPLAMPAGMVGGVLLSALPADVSAAAQPAQHVQHVQQGATATWGLLGDASPGHAQALAAASASPAVPVGVVQAQIDDGLAAASRPTAAPGTMVADAQSRQGVRIGDVGLMLTYEDSSELTDMPALSYLPNAPVWVKGLANLHGSLVPVFDMARYLGIQPGTQSADRVAKGRNKPMLLVLGHGAEVAGVIIDSIPQRLVPTPQQQTDTDTAPALLMPHIRGAYLIDDQLWFDLDCSSLLDMLEHALMHQA